MPSNISYVTGNLLEADTEALVNAVNTVGVMGKGLALQFKQAFSDNYRAYAAACKRGDVRAGEMFVTETQASGVRRLIINFPTKRDWRARSKIEDIEAGLDTLVSEIRARSIRSIALPALGCGLGGLDWEAVRPLIESAFARLPDVRVLVYLPQG
jgi:O-acetyl-ADP-ribose deacetylase (regulator of RNase III)